MDLFLLAIPVAVISWAIAKEEVVRECREWLQNQHKNTNNFLLWRKFCFMWTCEYCLSLYISIFWVWFTGYQLMLTDFRGYVIATFAVQGVAVAYMSVYNLLRVDIRLEQKRADHVDRLESGGDKDGHQEPPSPRARLEPRSRY